MRKVEISLPDDLATMLELEATKHGLELGDFISQLADRRLSDLVPQAPQNKKWMPREQWDALVRGKDCPLCSELSLNEPANVYGYTIADLGLSRLRLSTNQSAPGYCILICKKHVREPYDLDREERQLYFSDMMRAAQALEQVFAPVKMNFELLGNAVPHLHCHIKPRFYGDAAPNSPIDVDKSPLYLTRAEYDERVRLIQKALGQSIE